MLALKELLDAGKIKSYGLSNGASYSVCEFVKQQISWACETGEHSKLVCLLHRSYETELAETCAPSHHNISLLPWTPLAGGALSGKYLSSSETKKTLPNSCVSRSIHQRSFASCHEEIRRDCGKGWHVVNHHVISLVCDASVRQEYHHRLPQQWNS